MKKINIVLGVLILMSFSVHAQFKFGVKAGANFPSIKDIAGYTTDNTLQYHGGLMIEFKAPAFGIGVDALYSAKASNLKDAANLAASTFDFKTSYIDVPVLLKIGILKVFDVHLGPQFSFLMNAKLDNIDVKEELKSSLTSGVLGLGIDISRLHSAIRYNFGLSKLGVTGTEFEDSKMNVFQVSLGVWLQN